MPVLNALDFTSASAAESALKKVKQWMVRGGQPVVATEFIDKPRRSNGITYREATLTLASGQLITLRVNATGDIFQAVLNSSVVPIKNHDDMAKAVGELASLAEKNQAAFQKAQARVKVALPPGLSTPKPKMAEALQQRVTELDTRIADRKATVADLQQQLGAMTDSTASSEEAAAEQRRAAKMPLAAAYVAARDIVTADPVMLDSVATAGAVAQLRIALDVVETNYPINVEAGNLEQAQLQQDLAASFKLAIGMLDSAPTAISDAGLAQLVAIALVSAAESEGIADQAALAELLGLGMVETESGLYMVTAKGTNALDDAGYDPYGEPYAVSED